ncbi:TonB-dependent receptor [Wenyingzhuangia sp. 1_MG-2023]|nr:TonB-dependent receptor [Wenyingzhuangia sp. 1_MG-2023]
MKKYTILLLMVFFAATSFAQKIKISGKVTNTNGEPLTGVSIIIKGESKGTVSDFDGLYSLKVQPKNTLVFNYLGFAPKEIRVNNKTIINVKLEETGLGLDEVIVVGYGSVKKKDLTGSVAKVDTEAINNTATTNFDQALAGRVSGVNITSLDGTPGETVNIVIRGGNSITGDNTPLYVVDGIPLEDFDPGTISTNDIETFDILKDASATAIYGSRAANGVILISTKKGRNDGKTDVRINASHSYQWIPNRLEVLSPYEYVKYQEQVALALDAYTPGDRYKFFAQDWVDPELYKNNPGTSWQDEIFRVAQTNKYNASISSGDKNSRLYFSTEYIDQEGTLINTGFKKFVNNLKFTRKLNNNKTEFSGNMLYTHLNRSGLKISGDKYTSVIRDAIQFRPVEPINNDDLELGGYDAADINQRYLYNPIKNLENTDRQSRYDVIRGGLSLKHKFKSNLYLNLSANYQIDTRKESVFFGEDTQQGARGTDHINGSITQRRNQTLSSSNTLTYKKHFGKNDFTFLGGMELQTRSYEYAFLQNSEIPTDLFGIDNLGLGTSPSIPQTSISKNALLSYFSRVNYAFKNKYLITATYRADGSSKFNSNNRWGYFPSFSTAWKLSEEKFIKNLNFVSFAKVRAGWGKTGNNRVGDYQAYSQLNINTGSGYAWGQGQNYIPGAYQSNLGIPDLRWETTAQTNIGVDFGLFDQKVEATIDYYNKQTSDLLLNAETAPHTGYDKVQQNVGKIQNKGFEFTLTTKNINTQKFKWTSSFNIAFNRNKTLALNSGQKAIYTDPEWNNGYTENQYITKVGQPVGMMYGLKYDGIYQWDDFNWDNNLQTYSLKEGIPDNGTLPVAPGSIKFKDIDGNGTINNEDRVIIGNPHPKHFGGLSNDFKIGNFDLQVLLQWSYGFDILNANKAVFNVPGAGTQNGFKGLADAWTPTNTDTDVNTIRYLSVFGAAPKGNKIDDRHIEDGSYLRLNTVSLGYTMPKRFVETIHVKRMRFYVTGQNLFTWTNYSGYNPDVSVGKFGALTPNLDYSAYPQSITIMSGLDITF